MSKQIGHVIFILPKDGFGPGGSAIGRKYKAVGGGWFGCLKSAQRCPLGQHALGIHILRNRGSGLVAMAYRAEHLNTVLRDYPDVLTEDSVRWLGLEDYDESVEWMPEGKWCGDAPRHREWLVYRLGEWNVEPGMRMPGMGCAETTGRGTHRFGHYYVEMREGGVGSGCRTYQIRVTEAWKKRHERTAHQ